MQGGDRTQAVVSRCLEHTTCLDRSILKDFYSARLFRIGKPRTGCHEMLRIMFPLTVVKNGFHERFLRLSSATPLRESTVSSGRSSNPSRA